MSGPRLPIARIRNAALRRVAMVIVFPLLILWHFNWRLLAFPLAVIWNATEAAVIAARDSIRSDLSVRSIRLLALGWKTMWRGSQVDAEPTREA